MAVGFGGIYNAPGMNQGLKPGLGGAPTVPYGYMGGQGVGPLGPVGQPASFRPETGSYMTDAEFGSWQRNLPIEALKKQTDITTAAQKDILGTQFAGQGGLLGQQIAGQMSLQTDAEKAAEARQKEAESAQSAYLSQEAGLQASAEGRRQAALQGLLGQLGVTGGGSNVGGGISGAYGGGEEAANAATFARAKDIAGQIGRSSITGLQNVMSGRGLGTSGIATSQVGQAINQGATQLGQTNRDIMNTQAAINRQRAAELLQANVAIRGQNMGLVGQAVGGLTSRAY